MRQTCCAKPSNEPFINLLNSTKSSINTPSQHNLSTVYVEDELWRHTHTFDDVSRHVTQTQSEAHASVFTVKQWDQYAQVRHVTHVTCYFLHCTHFSITPPSGRWASLRLFTSKKTYQYTDNSSASCFDNFQHYNVILHVSQWRQHCLPPARLPLRGATATRNHNNKRHVSTVSEAGMLGVNVGQYRRSQCGRLCWRQLRPSWRQGRVETTQCQGRSLFGVTPAWRCNRRCYDQTPAQSTVTHIAAYIVDSTWINKKYFRLWPS